MSTTLRNASGAPESAVSLVGTTVGKYEIVGVLGKGGMGCVYEAVNTVINKRVAMKCIDHELAANEEANARFQREAISASAVDSAHIVQIFDAGTTDEGTPYIVMELLRGQDLGAYLAERGKLGVEETLHITAQILKGLHHAHEAGIVHRDLKPDNVFLVEREGEPLFVKLLDFGVSKIARTEKDVPLETLTRQGTVVGTPYYMSPEQAQAFPDVDGRTDIYSIGAIMYECLAARPPHTGQSYEQVIVNICMKDVAPIHELNPAVSAAVSALVHKALGREREDRFASARDMLDALLEAAPHSMRTSTPSGGAIRLPPGAATTRPEGTRTGRVSYPTERQVITTPTAHQTHELAQTLPAQPKGPSADARPEGIARTVDDDDAGRDETIAPDQVARDGDSVDGDSVDDDRVDDDRVDGVGVDDETRAELSRSGVSAKTSPGLHDDEAPASEVPGVPRRRRWGGPAIAIALAASVVGVYASRHGDSAGPERAALPEAPPSEGAPTAAPELPAALAAPPSDASSAPGGSAASGSATSGSATSGSATSGSATSEPSAQPPASAAPVVTPKPAPTLPTPKPPLPVATPPKPAPPPTAHTDPSPPPPKPPPPPSLELQEH